MGSVIDFFPADSLFLLMQASFQSLKGFPQPFWLALFVEGTRFTEAKLQAAQEFAASAGLPKPTNVLIPRTKARFHTILEAQEIRE